MSGSSQFSLESMRHKQGPHILFTLPSALLPPSPWQVLLEQLQDVKRAGEYASKSDEAPVWSELGHAQLRFELVADAIASYLRAGDSSNYAEVWWYEGVQKQGGTAATAL